MRFDRVAQGALQVDQIAIAAPLTDARQHPGLLEIGNDVVGRAFGNTDLGRHLPQYRIGTPRETNQQMRVVGEEGPTSGRRDVLFHNQSPLTSKTTSL